MSLSPEAPSRVPSAAVPATKHRPLPPALRRRVEALARRTGTPGIAVGVLHKGIAHAGGVGVTNLDAPVPVDENTLFQIGSTTKTFTATAAMKLVERGKLALDRPVRRWVRDLELPEERATRRATLEHLFTHTGGWLGDHWAHTGRGDDALAKVVESLRKVPQLTPLGEVWSYNNAGFYLAGRVLELVTGKPYEQVIAEMLFRPLGMERSFFFAEDAIAYPVAAGHAKVKGRQVVLRPWGLPRSVNPAGGIVSSVLDQLRWARFHLGDGTTPQGKRLLRRSTLRLMQQPHAPAGGMADAVGISWLLRDVDGVRLVGHGGTTYGQLSAFAMVPERGFAITILTNSMTGRAVYGGLQRWALEHFLGILDRDPRVRTLPPRELAEYGGRYRPAGSPWAIAVRASRGGLVAAYIRPKSVKAADVAGQIPPPMRLGFFAEDRARVLDGPLKGGRVEFLRDPRGRITWMRFGGRIHKRSGTGDRR